jgi:hypothetical protein
MSPAQPVMVDSLRRGISASSSLDSYVRNCCDRSGLIVCSRRNNFIIYYSLSYCSIFKMNNECRPRNVEVRSFVFPTTSILPNRLLSICQRTDQLRSSDSGVRTGLTYRMKQSAFIIPHSALACGADRDRTDDLLVANQALSQLSYSPVTSVVFPHRILKVGLGRVERPTSRLSGVRSNHLSYRPKVEKSKT